MRYLIGNLYRLIAGLGQTSEFECRACIDDRWKSVCCSVSLVATGGFVSKLGVTE